MDFSKRTTLRLALRCIALGLKGSNKTSLKRLEKPFKPQRRGVVLGVLTLVLLAGAPTLSLAQPNSPPPLPPPVSPPVYPPLLSDVTGPLVHLDLVEHVTDFEVTRMFDRAPEINHALLELPDITLRDLREVSLGLRDVAAMLAEHDREMPELIRGSSGNLFDTIDNLVDQIEASDSLRSRNDRLRNAVLLLRLREGYGAYIDSLKQARFRSRQYVNIDSAYSVHVDHLHRVPLDTVRVVYLSAQHRAVIDSLREGYVIDPYGTVVEGIHDDAATAVAILEYAVLRINAAWYDDGRLPLVEDPDLYADLDSLNHHRDQLKEAFKRFLHEMGRNTEYGAAPAAQWSAPLNMLAYNAMVVSLNGLRMALLDVLRGASEQLATPAPVTATMEAVETAHPSLERLYLTLTLFHCMHDLIQGRG